MHTLSAAGAGRVGDRNSDLQQIRPASEETLARDLKKAAEHLARLAADRDLVLHLGLHGYRGPPWRKFAAALAQYGFAVLRGWARSGEVFEKCRRKGIGLERGPDLSGDDADELALETVAEAILAFRDKVLIPGKWDPTREASLNTFFVGQCVFCFANVYRRWVTEKDIPPSPHELEVTLNAIRIEPVRVDRQVELKRELAKLSGRDATSFDVYYAAGYSQQDVAAEFGMSTRAVESFTYRDKKLKKRGQQSE